MLRRSLKVIKVKGACASKLILECLNNGIYPSWDSANRASAALAVKLGYHFESEYITYSVSFE